MKNSPFFWAFLIVVAVAAALYWQFSRIHIPPPMPTVEPQPLPVPAPPGELPISHPVVEPSPETREGRPDLDLTTPLPELHQADGRMAGILAKLFGTGGVEKYFILDNFIQRFVIMVDTLPQKEMPETRLPVRAVPGKFKVMVGEGDLVIDPANYRRYTPFIRLGEAVDQKALVTVYSHFYPLFQQAYENLGYPHGYFNDRLIEVIDHLLAAPVLEEPIRLVQSKIRYQFVDPKLEAFSAGWKILIRTGPENAERIKGILREYRVLLTALEKNEPPSGENR